MAKYYVPKKVEVYQLFPVSHQGTPIIGRPLSFNDRKTAIDEIKHLRSVGLHYKLVVA